MKLLIFCLLWLSASWPALAADASATAPPRLSDAAKDAEDQEFHDPFAKEPAAGPAKAKISDPLEPMNRAFFKFNDRAYFWVLRPAARGYNKVAPEPFRASIRRLFVNARYPVRLINNLLQGKFKGAGIETARFLVNSTLGIGGLFDPAREECGLRAYPEDLDQTLGFYGLPMGIYFDWPLIGPSSARGTAGLIGDSFLVPWTYIDGAPVLYGTRVYDSFNSVSLQLGDYESLKRRRLIRTWPCATPT